MLLTCLQAYKGVERNTEDCSFLGFGLQNRECRGCPLWDSIDSLQGWPWACEFQRTRLFLQGTDLDFVGRNSCPQGAFSLV